VDCEGNVERAIDSLLNMGTIHSDTASIQTPSTDPTTTNAQSHQLTQLELDELLARELANDFSASHQHSHHKPTKRSRAHQPPASKKVELGPIDPTVLKELVDGVKSTMLPELQKQFKTIEIPPVKEKIDGGKMGQVEVSLGEIRVSEAKVPEENVDITVDGLNINISVKGVTAKLQQFKWGYEKNTFPKLKDSGNADASISEATIDVALKIVADQNGNPNVHVTNCLVNAGKLDVKITGSLASFLYNALLGIFKDSIKSTLETSLAEMITSSVNNDDGGSDDDDDSAD